MTRSLIAGSLLFGGLAAAQPSFTLSGPNGSTQYTSSTSVTVTVNSPGDKSGRSWCISETGTLPCSPWKGSKEVLSPFTLSNQQGLHTVYLWYKDGGINSPRGFANITLDTTPPSVTLFSPSGLSTGWPQTLSTNPQFVTWAASDNLSPVTINLNLCENGSCTTQLATALAASPGVWEWQSPPAAASARVQIAAIDGAGNQTVVKSNPAFSVGTPSLQIDCGPAGCPTLDPGELPFNDGNPVDGITFSGFADPSMRRDPSDNGTTLWMLYSYPEVQTVVPSEPTSVVEIHLTSSTDGGVTWQNPTPIWRSEYSNGQYSSHEVSNFWPDNGNWYAVHLEYTVKWPNSIAQSVPDGSLVTTVASSPAALASATNHTITYDSLTSAAGLPQGSCTSWGEPAVTVQNVQNGLGTVAYLLTMCISQGFSQSKYYIFYNTDLGGLAAKWVKYSGPFDLSTLFTADPGLKSQFPSAQFLTELDLSQRSDSIDGSDLVVVVTPAAVIGKAEYQYGCVAVNFNLANKTAPFGAVTQALLFDSGSTQPFGSNACTYDPGSLTGMLIVRRLMAQNSFLVSMLSSGLMP